MQTEMADTYPDVMKLKKESYALIRIMGDDCEARGEIEGQISEFNTCWINLGDEIQERVRKVKKCQKTALSHFPCYGRYKNKFKLIQNRDV